MFEFLDPASYIIAAIIFIWMLFQARKYHKKKNTENTQKPVKSYTPLVALTYSDLAGIRQLVTVCYNASVAAGWHHDLQTGEKLNRNKGEMLCLIHSEISEAMEGLRKNLMDDKLSHRKMAEVELADAVIRICDFCGMMNYDLAGAIVEKLDYNANRADHKPENRLKEDGKKF